VTGKLVAYCLDKSKELDQLSLEELRGFHAAFEESVYDDMNLDNVVSRRNSAGGTSFAQVQQQLLQAGAAMEETTAWLAAANNRIS
jgi:argininosuccinate lyase